MRDISLGSGQRTKNNNLFFFIIIISTTLLYSMDTSELITALHYIPLTYLKAKLDSKGLFWWNKEIHQMHKNNYICNMYALLHHVLRMQFSNTLLDLPCSTTDDSYSYNVKSATLKMSYWIHWFNYDCMQISRILLQKGQVWSAKHKNVKSIIILFLLCTTFKNTLDLSYFKG